MELKRKNNDERERKKGEREGEKRGNGIWESVRVCV